MVEELELKPGGKTWEPGAFEQLLGDVSSKVGRYGDDITLGAERPHLTEWRERGW